MPSVWIKEVLVKKGNKFKIDDVSFSAPVSELKKKLAESSGIDENQQDIIYHGLLLKDEKTMESYGLKDGSALHIIYRTPPNVPEDVDVHLDMGVEDMMPVLEAAVTSPLYKDKMSALLKNPETLENIVATTPGLIHDPVALTILRDPETLQNLVDSGDITRLAQEHPALVQAASHLAADITKDLGASRLRRSSNSDDDDLMDLDPEILAQAEMMAANEEQIQNRQNPTSTPVRGSPPGANVGRVQPNRPITSSFFASALQAARANLVSTSTQTASVNAPSTSTEASRRRQPISSEFFNQAMASALNASNERNNWQVVDGKTETSRWLGASKRSELRQLREMGIEDEALSLRALSVTDGNVQAACDLIFEGFD